MKPGITVIKLTLRCRMEMLWVRFKCWLFLSKKQKKELQDYYDSVMGSWK